MPNIIHSSGFWRSTKPPPGSQINWDHPLSKGLVGCWLMNEGAGNSITNIALGVTSKGTGLKWDGLCMAGGFVDCGNLPQYQITGGMTISARIGGPTISNIDTIGIVNKYAFPPKRGYFFGYSSPSNAIEIITSINPNDKYVVTVNDIFYGNRYESFTMVFRPKYGLDLYKYNKLIGRNNTTPIPDLQYSASNNLHIGRRADGFGGNFSGKIDRVFIYNRALDSSGITELDSAPYSFILPPTVRRYFSPLATPLYAPDAAPAKARSVVKISRDQKPPIGSQINWDHPLSKGLVGCWLMNEGAGSITRCLVSPSNTGNLTNGACFKNNGVYTDGINDRIDVPNFGNVLDGKYLTAFIIASVVSWPTSRPRFVDRIYNEQICVYSYPDSKYIGFGAKASNGSTFNGPVTNLGISTGAKTNIAVTWDGLKVYGWVNTIKSPPALFVAPGLATCNYKLTFGTSHISGPESHNNCIFYATYLWPFALSDAAILALNQDPYCFILPPNPPRRIFTPLALLQPPPRPTSWALRAITGGNRPTLWHDRQEIADQQATTWNDRQEIADQQATTWNDRQEIADQQATTWHDRALIHLDHTASWNDREIIAGDRNAGWRVRMKVEDDRTAEWQVREVARSDRTATWHYHQLVALARALTWKAYFTLSRNLATTWNDLETKAYDRSTTWDTCEIQTCIRDLIWNDLETKASGRSTTWADYQQAFFDRATGWSLNETIPSSQATTWNVWGCRSNKRRFRYQVEDLAWHPPTLRLDLEPFVTAATVTVPQTSCDFSTATTQVVNFTLGYTSYLH